MANIYVFSHDEFDILCKNMGWDDSNVESLNDYAFISIVGTEACRKEYLQDETSHWFKNEHSNVLNLEFDDLEKDLTWHGFEFKAMTEDDAKKSLEFIEQNIGKNFYIHCKAGASRSQGFFRAIVDLFNDVYKEDCGRNDNPCLTPNNHVVRLLKRAFYEKNHIFGL